MTDIFYDCPKCEGRVNATTLEFMEEKNNAGMMLNTRIKLTCDKGHSVEWNV
jgi:hypothetical protein